MKELNLNDAQKKEYEKSKEEIRAGIAEAIERKKDFHRIVHEEMDKENPDINALAGLMKERVQNIPDMVSKPIDLFVNFYNLLDENQKAKVIEMFRARMGGVKGFVHHRGTEDTEGFFFFVYREIPIDENNLSSIDPLKTACFGISVQTFSFAGISRQMKMLFSVRSVSLW